MSTIRKSLEEIEKESPVSRERLKAIQAIPDEDIDTSDIPELDEEWWQNATVRSPGSE